MLTIRYDGCVGTSMSRDAVSPNTGAMGDNSEAGLPGFDPCCLDFLRAPGEPLRVHDAGLDGLLLVLFSMALMFLEETCSY